MTQQNPESPTVRETGAYYKDNPKYPFIVEIHRYKLVIRVKGKRSLRYDVPVASVFLYGATKAADHAVAEKRAGKARRVKRPGMVKREI